jgi:hypothetical protein
MRRADHRASPSAAAAGARHLYGHVRLNFCLVNFLKLPGYYASGLFGQVSLIFALRFVPLVVVGAVWILGESQNPGQPVHKIGLRDHF